MSLAYEAIKGGEYLPDLEHVTIKRNVYGVRSDKISSPLTISDSRIRDNQFAGIQIKGRSKALTFQNTAVGNTTGGDGLSYSEIVPDPVDFCSVDDSGITVPITLQAIGKARTNVECTKVTLYAVLLKMLKPKYRDKTIPVMLCNPADSRKPYTLPLPDASPASNTNCYTFFVT